MRAAAACAWLHMIGVGLLILSREDWLQDAHVVSLAKATAGGLLFFAACRIARRR